MSFLSMLPTATFVLLTFALLGFCNYLKSLYRYSSKIEFFNEYRNALVTFHNRYVEDNEMDSELANYLLENVHEVNSDSGCTAYGFLDHSLKEDCDRITISIERSL